MITTVPEELKQALIGRLETEDFKHAPLDNIIAVLSAGADVSLAERVFLKVCELRRVITSAPHERHEFEWVVERQLETLLRAFPANISVTGLSKCFSKAVDGVELDVLPAFSAAWPGQNPIFELSLMGTCERGFAPTLRMLSHFRFNRTTSQAS